MISVMLCPIQRFEVVLGFWTAAGYVTYDLLCLISVMSLPGRLAHAPSELGKTIAFKLPDLPQTISHVVLPKVGSSLHLKWHYIIVPNTTKLVLPLMEEKKNQMYIEIELLCLHCP